MKKRVLTLLAVCLLATGLLAGCGSSANSAAGATAERAPIVPATPAASSPAGTMEMEYGYDTQWSVTAPSESESPAAQSGKPAKRVYTANMTLETQSFDEAVEKLAALVEETGGWFQESSVRDYGGGYRRAEYTVRVPAEKFQGFVTQVGELCHVTWQSSSCEDVSERYYDTAGRLKTQQTKLDRLQELLAKADDMADIITIESAISETEQAIDALSGELRYYDARVDHSTVSMTLEEVYRLTETEQSANTFASRLGVALDSGWKGFVSGMQDLAIFLAYSWMWLLVLIGLIALAALLSSRLRRKRKRAFQAKRGDPVQLDGQKPDDRSAKT